MSIKDNWEKIKLYLADMKDNVYSMEKGLKIKDDLYIVTLIILVGAASFGLGKISTYEKTKTPISILKTKEYMLSTVLEGASSINNKTINEVGDTNQNGVVVASKSGTKYYYPWCAGVSKIKEENKVWFDSIEEAKLAGLTPATNCEGLN
jgi:hypothetical protein